MFEVSAPPVTPVPPENKLKLDLSLYQNMLKGQGTNITMMTITVRDLMRKRVDTIEETEIFSEGIRSIRSLILLS